MIEITCHINHFLISGNDLISLESRPLKFRVFIHDATDVFPVVANTRIKSIQKQIKSIDVDKVRSKKPLASKSCFV